MLKHFLALLICLTPLYANANDLPAELRNFEGLSGLLPVTDSTEQSVKRSSSKPSIIPYIEKTIKRSAAHNITNFEQVFCYHIQRPAQNYTGYTINNYAITDYCGELDTSTIATSYEALFTQGPNIITTSPGCNATPKIMLRFARGVEYTDVLLSYPCALFAVYHAGKQYIFNIKQGVINDLISQFDNKSEPFNSPTLLKQTVANAIISTVEDASKLDSKKRENELKMSWQKDEQSDATPKAKTQNNTTSATGWGKIKLRK